MIESFKCKETDKIFHRQYSRKLPTMIQKVAFRKLRMLHRSSTVEDLRVLRVTDWKLYQGDEEGNTAFGLMMHGAFASFGVIAMLMLLK